MHTFSQRYTRFKSHSLALLLLLLTYWYCARRSTLEALPDNEHPIVANIDSQPWPQFHHDLATTQAETLSVILPVTPESISQLHLHLEVFLDVSPTIQEVIIICIPSLVPIARKVVKAQTEAYMRDGVELVIYSLIGGLEYSTGLIDAAARATSDWILLADQHGILHENARTRQLLLHPPPISLPVGPRGCNPETNGTHMIEGNLLYHAKYLHLPFVIPSHLVYEDPSGNGMINTFWRGSTTHLTPDRRATTGLALHLASCDDCTEDVSANRSVTCTKDFIRPVKTPSAPYMQLNGAYNDTGTGARISTPKWLTFTIALASVQELDALLPTLCAFQEKGHRIQLTIPQVSSFPKGKFDQTEGIRWAHSSNCTLGYTSTQLDSNEAFLSDWIETRSPVDPDVLILSQDFRSGHGIEDITRKYISIILSKEEMPHTSWMTSLSSEEWLDWKKPQLEISVITNNRPQSLKRLLDSLSRGLFFGDTVNIQIYLEQTADKETLKISSEFSWPHGDVYEHHRIMPGGLMAAVVESWYPHNNHSYGLILEDDTEVSPLFYAWIKMNLLRYRYGNSTRSNFASKVFGLSLYQQKIVELRPEGRRLFDARQILQDTGKYDPISPYLSPIPCSWGAVYFPEHWRVFHSYLLHRLLEKEAKITEVIVPGVRSNNWSRSWKKYFIEFAFLRGLVMIYPNYPGYFSLSTNHLEPGSHVKARTAAKKDLFLLPLLPLGSNNHAEVIPNILSLPGQTLPALDLLPIFNLTGDLTSLEQLGEQGKTRCEELNWCHQDIP